MASKSFYAVIAGVGGGTGRSVALRFARAYPVVLLARRPESVDEIVTEIKKAGGEAVGVATDLTDPQSVKSAFEKIKTELPDTKLAAAVYNVSSGFVRKPFLEQKLEDLQAGLAGSAIGFFNFAQATIPLLLEAVPESKYPPTLIATGATASIKGSANFGTFAAGKFALRALTQSLAREFGPKGVHVAHAIIDGVIAGPRTAGFTVNGGAPDGKLDPDAIAEAYWALHAQHRSALASEIDLRPYVEKW